ncbi:MAG: RNA methyltransferase PUA domain-containing protein [Planctomycetaceae bacterium]
MANRYYHNGNWEAGDVWLTDQEAHHLLHVMRHRVGEQVELFDGRGHAARATIVEIKSDRFASTSTNPCTHLCQPAPAR